MKVKLFSGSNYRSVEKTVAIWLASHPAIKIHFIGQSQEGGFEDSVGIIVITVWYEEGKSEN